jgi:hypothetical protein
MSPVRARFDAVESPLPVGDALDDPVEGTGEGGERLVEAEVVWHGESPL